jgi:hypothetical protein
MNVVMATLLDHHLEMAFAHPPNATTFMRKEYPR